MKNHIFKFLESIEYFYVVAVVLSFCNPSPKLIWLNINSGSLPLLISSSVRLEPFQWENLSSIIAISRFFFVSTRLPFFLLYFHFISTFLILILSGRQFIFPFSDSALASGLSVLEQQSPLPKTYTGLWRLQRISQVFHFQFSLTVCLRSFTFWGGDSCPCLPPFSSSSPLLERVFFLLVLVTLSPTWLSFYFSGGAKLFPQGTKRLVFLYLRN